MENLSNTVCFVNVTRLLHQRCISCMQVVPRDLRSFIYLILRNYFLFVIQIQWNVFVAWKPDTWTLMTYRLDKYEIFKFLPQWNLWRYILKRGTSEIFFSWYVIICVELFPYYEIMLSFWIPDKPGFFLITCTRYVSL